MAILRGGGGGSSAGSGGGVRAWYEIKKDNSTDVSFDGRTNHTAVVFDDKSGTGEALWVIGGSFQGFTVFKDVWKSTDGKIWTEVTSDAGFPARDGHTTVKFKDELWVIGGFDGTTALNDVWTSPDGKKWDDLTKDAVFGKRYNHTTVVFDDGSGEALWVIGGYDGSRKNDVWKSADGETWTQVTSAVGFSGRYDHTSAVFDGALWVIGGTGTSSYLNDVWKSTYGITWQEITAEGPVFSGRYGHTTAVFDDGSGEALWVIGGSGNDDSADIDIDIKNEVWKYQ